MYNKDTEAVKPQDVGYIDLWHMNVGECKAWFYGVCQQELDGKVCDEPSEYGCHFRGDF